MIYKLKFTYPNGQTHINNKYKYKIRANAEKKAAWFRGVLSRKHKVAVVASRR
jgi:hypothetical protein